MAQTLAPTLTVGEIDTLVSTLPVAEIINSLSFEQLSYLAKSMGFIASNTIDYIYIMDTIAKSIVDTSILYTVVEPTVDTSTVKVETISLLDVIKYIPCGDFFKLFTLNLNFEENLNITIQCSKVVVYKVEV
jgi:hypothetical protein